MDENNSNVVPFPAAPIELPAICIPPNVESAMEAFRTIEVMAEMAQNVLALASVYGDATVLAHTKKITEALARSFDNLRTGRQIEPARIDAAKEWVNSEVRATHGADTADKVAGQLAAARSYLLNPENRGPDPAA